jgi:hypothetical protein
VHTVPNDCNHNDIDEEYNGGDQSGKQRAEECEERCNPRASADTARAGAMQHEEREEEGYEGEGASYENAAISITTQKSTS